MSQSIENAADMLAAIEAHCGSAVEDRRLRFAIVQNMQRLIDNEAALLGNVQAVLDGCKTFNPKYQKAINKSQGRS